MRENRPYGSEGRESEINRAPSPLCAPRKAFDLEGGSPFQANVASL